MKPIIILLFSIFSCNTKTIPQKEVKDYTKQIILIKKYAKSHNYNKNKAFMIDYSLHSGLPRFFVVDLKNNKIT